MLKRRGLSVWYANGGINIATDIMIAILPLHEIRKLHMRTQQKISAKAREQWIGKQMEVLVEGVSEETDLLWEGRTMLHAPEIDGKVLINDFGDHETLVPGSFYRCEITEAHDYDVVARILD